MSGPPRYHEDEDNPIESQRELDRNVHLVTHSRWYSGGSRKAWRRCLRCWPPRSCSRERRRELCRWTMIAIVIATLLGVIAAIVYLSLINALLSHLAPPPGNSGLQRIVDNWREPDDHGSYKYEWRDDFSQDVVPKNCHSHNDYWRRVPLFDALAAGCVSVEADIWLTANDELLVSHSWRSTTRFRTLRSLYLDPLTNILERRNVTAASVGTKEVGIFDDDPGISVVLLIDFKNDGQKTWPVLVDQLQPLRDKDWLTYYDGSVLHQGPITVVGTGNAPFELVQQSSANRFIFFDAPLLSISDDRYNTTNSYYASVEMKKAIGGLRLNRLSAGQAGKLAEQIHAADAKGLKSRYWGEPRWPISLRDKMWFKLTELKVGMLSVDDLVSATRWNWNWCVVAGLTLCGSS